jgi:hypothetical protein
VATDHGDLRSCIDGRKGDSIAVVDREEAPRERRSTDGRIAGPELAQRIIILEHGRNWNHGIRKWIRGSMRRIAGRKAGWFETTLACARNRTLAQGHDPGSYEGGANAKGAYA